MVKPEIPMSREVRLQQGITHGILEDTIFRAHTGSSSDLAHLIVAGELIVENERSHAVEAFSDILRSLMTAHGTLSLSELEEGLRLFHSGELDERPQ